MADQFPQKFGKYKIIEEVGRGGFADVYSGRWSIKRDMPIGNVGYRQELPSD